MRVLHMTFEMTDEEAATLLANIGAAGVVTGVSHTAPAAAAPVADPAPVAAPVTTAPATDAAEKPKGRGRPKKTEGAPAADPAPVAAPVTPAAPAGLPGVVPAGLPMPAAPVTKPPVSYDELIAKYTALSGAGKISAEQAIAFYAECGITDPTTLTTNETQRRALMDRLESIS